MNAENAGLVLKDGPIIKYWESTDDQWGEEKKPSHRVVQKAASSDTGYHLEDCRLTPSASQMTGGIQSCAAAAMRFNGNYFGAIYCDVRKMDRQFDDQQARFLKELADIFCVYLYAFSINDSAEDKLAASSTSQLTPAEVEKVMLDRLVGFSEQMTKLREEIKRTAKIALPVLILGESGTGKEEVARCIHNLSPRRNRHFVPVNCASISRDLSESEFFGHKKGAFTGANTGRPGLILQSHGGSLFLDEIGDMPLEIQAKLLRVLESREVRQVGSDSETNVDFRLIAATNKDLRTLVKEGKFREDLYYRIYGRVFTLPPLRDRREDIVAIAKFFAKPKLLSNEAIDFLKILDYPGNVRQLKKVVELARELSAHPTIISRDDIAREYDSLADGSLPAAGLTGSYSQSDALIQEVLQGSLKLQDLRRMWNHREISPSVLRLTLERLYEQGESWFGVARMLGVQERSAIQTFSAWIRYLRETKVLPPNTKSTNDSLTAATAVEAMPEADLS